MKTVTPKPANSSFPPPTAVLPAHRPWWQYALLSLALLIAVSEVYGPSLHGPFVLDDNYLPMFMQNVDAQPLSQWVGVRPLLGFSYWLNYQASQLDSYSYHLVNILLHKLTALMVVLITRRLLTWAGTTDARRDGISLFAGALFLLHPVQTEAVAYIAGRSETLSVLLFYAAFAVFLYRREQEISFPSAVLVLVLFGLAALSKEHAVMLPFLLLLTDYFWNPGFTFEGIRKNWRLYALILAGALLAGILVVRTLLTSTSAGLGLKDFTWYQYFFTQCRVIWNYVLLFVAPFKLNADYDYTVSRTIMDHGALFGLLGLLVISALAFVNRKKFPLASYGWFTFLLLLAPTSSFLPIQDPIAERRLYLPFIGLLLIVAEGLRQIAWSRTVAVVLGVILVASAALTYQRSEVWGDSLKLWSDTVEKNPDKWRPRFQLGYAYFQLNRCADAVTQYEAAARLQPPDQRLLLDWALALDCEQKTDDALEKLQRAAALEPNAHVYATMGMIYGRKGQLDPAADALQKALKIDPNSDAAHAYMGNIDLLRNQPAQAVEEFRRALQINPTNPMAQQGLLNLRASPNAAR